MKHYNRNLHRIITGLALLIVFALGGASLSAFAQETKRGSGRDPFVPFKPAVKSKNTGKAQATLVTPPPIQVRIDSYKAEKLAAMSAQRPAPKPTTALLLGEMQVIGIFRTPRGYAAMIEATPINLSYVIYPGEIFYDGQLVAIEENRLVFRRETRWSDGKRETAVEIKPLRPANAVTDSMAATKGAGSAGANNSASKPAVESDKP